MASLSAITSQACQGTQGVIQLTSVSPGPGAAEPLAYWWTVLDGAGNEYGDGFTLDVLPVTARVPDGNYSVRVYATDANGAEYVSTPRSYTVSCAGNGSGNTLVLDSLTHADETAAGHDGTATIQASGGTEPYTAAVVELSLSQAASSGQPSQFTGLPVGGPYTVRITDSSSPTQSVEGTVTIEPYVAPVAGCQDEYADNYDPAATSGGTASCTYSPRWRAAWGPTGMHVAVAGQTEAFVEAKLHVGFRPGHPLAAQRPLGEAIALRATVGPDGYAVFRLGPYVQPLLGAPDGLGGYRLDLNSLGAHTTDLYVGYELRRVDDNTLLEHGYALNSAVPDERLTGNRLVLSPFARQPLWPGYEGLAISLLVDSGNPPVVYGGVGALGTEDVATVALPCPPNPLPVAWLNPWGGYSYWVFQGRTQLGDSVGDGQTFQEAATGELRYSERGLGRRTYQARSGVFRGADLAEGLATLWRSPQVWVQPALGGEWVPVSIGSGEFPVRRLGVGRNEVSVTFTEARPHYQQGQ